MNAEVKLVTTIDGKTVCTRVVSDGEVGAVAIRLSLLATVLPPSSMQDTYIRAAISETLGEIDSYRNYHHA